MPELTREHTEVMERINRCAPAWPTAARTPEERARRLRVLGELVAAQQIRWMPAAERAVLNNLASGKPAFAFPWLDEDEAEARKAMLTRLLAEGYTHAPAKMYRGPTVSPKGRAVVLGYIAP